MQLFDIHLEGYLTVILRRRVEYELTADRSYSTWAPPEFT
jgi:hypothetical protein